MNRIILFFSLAALLIGSLLSCDVAPISPDNNDPVPVEDVAAVAAMNRTLGWKIFNQQQLEKPGENVLVSPFSIQAAINMALNGAKGNTLAELLDLLECKNCDVADINTLHRNLTTLLAEQSGHPDLTVSNRFFYDDARMTARADFLETINTHYACGAEVLDFDAEEAALAAINDWVKNSTNGKIDRILNQITPLDVAFLINALHFKADWAMGFSEEMTYPASFRRPDGSEVTVPFVSADRDFSTAQTPGFRLVDIPFKDSTFSISFIQPSATNTASDWHQTITPATWEAMYAGMTYGRALVSFPKLKLAYENDLIAALKALGVNAPFGEATADFTDMGTASRNIFIKQIKHKAVLEVDEKGAEGAAVTSIGFGITSVPPSFRFDSPFVLVLRHTGTNTILFTGFVADPS